MFMSTRKRSFGALAILAFLVMILGSAFAFSIPEGISVRTPLGRNGAGVTTRTPIGRNGAGVTTRTPIGRNGAGVSTKMKKELPFPKGSNIGCPYKGAEVGLRNCRNYPVAYTVGYRSPINNKDGRVITKGIYTVMPGETRSFKYPCSRSDTVFFRMFDKPKGTSSAKAVRSDKRINSFINSGARYNTGKYCVGTTPFEIGGTIPFNKSVKKDGLFRVYKDSGENGKKLSRSCPNKVVKFFKVTKKDRGPDNKKIFKTGDCDAQDLRLSGGWGK